ncbi:MAG: hypothetical protein WAU07_00795, partial [Microgenomates group bacterium]
MTSLRPEEESLLPSHEIQPFQETQELSFISLEEEKKNTTLPHLIVVLAAFDSYLYRLQSLQNTEENQTDFNALLVALTVLASLLSVYLLFRKNKESPTDLELSLNIPGLDTLNDRVYKMHRYLQLDLAEQHLSELGEMYQNNPRRPFIIEDLKKDYQTARTVFHQEVGRLNILLDVTQDADSGSYELENALHGVTLRLENLEKAIDTIKARHAETSRKVQEAPKRLIEAKALHQKDMLKFPNSEA